jgi:hypothetical protein
VSKKSKKGQGKNQLKFTVGLKGLLPSGAQLYTNKEYPSEDIALREAVLNSTYKKDSIVVFDRGLKKRKAFLQFDQQGISFVTRASTDIKHEKAQGYKRIKGGKQAP